jgi:hypothetical protein
MSHSHEHDGHTHAHEHDGHECVPPPASQSSWLLFSPLLSEKDPRCVCTRMAQIPWHVSGIESLMGGTVFAVVESLIILRPTTGMAMAMGTDIHMSTWTTLASTKKGSHLSAVSRVPSSIMHSERARYARTVLLNPRNKISFATTRSQSIGPRFPPLHCKQLAETPMGRMGP